MAIISLNFILFPLFVSRVNEIKGTFKYSNFVVTVIENMMGLLPLWELLTVVGIGCFVAFIGLRIGEGYYNLFGGWLNETAAKKGTHRIIND